MLLRIDQRIINTDHISCADFKVTPATSTSTETIALWITLGGAPKGSPDIGLNGKEADRMWAKLTSMAEDITP